MNIIPVPLSTNATRASDIEARNIDWLWDERIPAHGLTILEGEPGYGKSFVAIDCAARLSAGRRMPFVFELTDFAPEDQNALYLTVENDWNATIRPRLDGANANLTKVHLLSKVKRGNAKWAIIKFPNDFDVLKGEIQDKNIKLTVIDPLSNFMPAGHDANNASHVANLFCDLHDLGLETKSAILVVRHFRKNSKFSSSPLDKGGGSIAATGTARSVLQLLPHQGHAGELLLVQAKCNVAEEARTIRCRRIRINGLTRLDWIELTNHRAEDFCYNPNAELASGEDENADEATAVLRAMLTAKGRMHRRDVYIEMKKQHFSEYVIKRASKALGVLSTPDHLDARKTWWQLGASA